MEDWIEKVVVFAATYFGGLYLWHRIEQRKPPKPSISSDFKRYFESDSDEIPESMKQLFVKVGKFFDDLNPGPRDSEAFNRAMAGPIDPEKRELLEKLFSIAGMDGSGSGEQENRTK